MWVVLRRGLVLGGAPSWWVVCGEEDFKLGEDSDVKMIC